MDNKDLRKIAEEDVKRISKTIQKDKDGKEFTWDKKRNCFSRLDDKKQLWLKGIDSSVAGYWSYCTNKTGHNTKGYETKCGYTHFVFIFENGETKKCNGCGKDYTINIVTGT